MTTNYRGNMMKIMRMRTFAILCGILVFASSICTAQVPEISVPGEGSVTVPADTTIVTVSAESNNQNATLATIQAEDSLNRAKDALIAAGVSTQDMLSGQGSGTSSFQSSSRVCRTVNNTTICDVSSNSANKVVKSLLIRVNTTDQGRVNDIISAAKSAGADATVTGYGLRNSQSSFADARKKAVQNARDNAQEYVTAASEGTGKALSVGKVLSISDYGTYSRPNVTQPGMVDVVSTVYVVYEIVG